jgi:hypothetical protein
MVQMDEKRRQKTAIGNRNAKRCVDICIPVPFPLMCRIPFATVFTYCTTAPRSHTNIYLKMPAPAIFDQEKSRKLSSDCFSDHHPCDRVVRLDRCSHFSSVQPVGVISVCCISHTLCDTSKSRIQL